MKQIALTSSQFDGRILFRFDFNGDLTGFEIDGVLNLTQRQWLLVNLPKTEAELRSKLTKTMKLTEIS